MSQWRRNVDEVRHMRMKLIEKGNGMEEGNLASERKKRVVNPL